MATVLIVEDDPINLRVFSKILTKRGGLSVKGTEDVDLNLPPYIYTTFD